VQTGSVVVTDLGSNIDVLNATTGVNVVLGDRATLSLAGEHLILKANSARVALQARPITTA